NHWVTLGQRGFENVGFGSYSLALSKKDSVHVAYDYYNGANVIKWDGNNWQQVGSTDFTAGTATHMSLTFSPNDTLYLSCREKGASFDYYAAAYKFNRTAWNKLGTTPAYQGGAYHTNVAIDINENVYLTYVDAVSNVERTRVEKFVNGSWVAVGGGPVSNDESDRPVFALQHDSIPYVAFIDDEVSSKATVAKLVKGKWQYVGAQGLTNDRPTIIDFDIDSDGTPYLGFIDATNLKANLLQFVPYTPHIGTGTSIYATELGQVQVIATNSNGCAAYDTITVSEPLNVSASITANQNNLCNGDAFSSAWVKVCGGTAPYTYAWSNSATNDTITNLAAGTYIVTVTDNNSNTAKDTIVITEPDAVIATIEEGDFAYMCPGDSVELSHKQQTGINYNWYQVGSDSSVWEAVGSLGFSQGKIREIKHAFNPSNNVPYVAFTNDDNYVTSTVMRFVNNQWELVGAAAFDTSVWYMDLEVASDGTP
ncbi:MAG: SprB repeat-containing protein, partial [Bacteroidia bacterium]